MKFRVFPVQELRPALRILTERYPVLHGVDSGIPIHFRRCKPGKLAKLVSPAQDGGLTISFDRPCRALRTLGLLMAELYRLSRTLPEKELRKTFARSAKRLAEGIPGTETCPFETFGVLIDCSHNAVPKPESLHRTFERLALLGFNRVLLYCEDTFKLEDEPFFGFHRGAYSAEEIRELDDYADALGLELVPSIQTLTHLEQLFRWRAYLPIHDIAGNLLVDSKRAYDLIEKMLRFWRDNVRSRVIHVGMDESRWLGSGRYRLLHPNAPQPPVIDLVARHANRIAELCETLELKPVMWGEAWWRAASKKHEYFDVKAVFPDELKLQIPDNMRFSHADYDSESAYKFITPIKRYRSIYQEPVVVSGISTANLFWYSESKTAPTLHAALYAMRKCEVKDVFFTLWGTDGAYCDFESAFIGLISCANQAYRDPKNHVLPSPPDQHAAIHGDDSYEVVRMVAKEAAPFWSAILWDDPLMMIGASSLQAETAPADSAGFVCDWAALPHRLRYISHILSRTPETPEGMGGSIPYARALLDVLLAKIELCNALISAWDNPPKQRRGAVRALALKMRTYLTAMEAFAAEHRMMWMSRNRPQGYETIQIRLAGAIERARECMRRTADYGAGRIDTIPELDDALALWAKTDAPLQSWSRLSHGTTNA